MSILLNSPFASPDISANRDRIHEVVLPCLPLYYPLSRFKKFSMIMYVEVRIRLEDRS